ncbi:MAG: hypothetical protein ABIP75_03170 [Pyrinomonadaceae bacterium]
MSTPEQSMVDRTQRQRLINFYTSAVIDVENIFTRATRWNNEPGRSAQDMIDPDPSGNLAISLQDLKKQLAGLEGK